jgi:hypothetical protein
MQRACHALAAPTSWRPLFLGFATYFVLAVVTLGAGLAASPSPTRNFTLTLLLFVNSALWFAATLLTRGAERPLPALGLDSSALVIIGAGIGLTASLSVRLMFSDRFGGSAPSFDFGFKCDGGNCTETNLAFEPGFNSFGHCIQGCLSLLLFPVAEHGVASAGGRYRVSAVLLLRLGAAGVAIYPAYNVAKRGVLHGAEFAASSFCNNGAEWASGFQLGLSSGLALTAAAHRRGLLVRRPTPWQLEAQNDGEVWPAGALRAVLLCRLLAGVLMSVAAVVAPILFAISWDSTSYVPTYVGARSYLVARRARLTQDGGHLPRQAERSDGASRRRRPAPGHRRRAQSRLLPCGRREAVGAASGPARRAGLGRQARERGECGPRARP